MYPYGWAFCSLAWWRYKNSLREWYTISSINSYVGLILLIDVSLKLWPHYFLRWVTHYQGVWVTAASTRRSKEFFSDVYLFWHYMVWWTYTCLSQNTHASNLAVKLSIVLQPSSKIDFIIWYLNVFIQTLDRFFVNFDFLWWYKLQNLWNIIRDIFTLPMLFRISKHSYHESL